MKIGINQNLKKYREMNGLTQQDVSEALNISRQSISKWENSKSYPDLDNLVLLSQLYNVSVDDLISGPTPTVHIKKQKKKKSQPTLAKILRTICWVIAILALCLIIYFLLFFHIS